MPKNDLLKVFNLNYTQWNAPPPPFQTAYIFNTLLPCQHELSLLHHILALCFVYFGGYPSHSRIFHSLAMMGNQPFIKDISVDLWHSPAAEHLTVELSLSVFVSLSRPGIEPTSPACEADARSRYYATAAVSLIVYSLWYSGTSAKSTTMYMAFRQGKIYDTPAMLRDPGYCDLFLCTAVKWLIRRKTQINK